MAIKTVTVIGVTDTMGADDCRSERTQKYYVAFYKFTYKDALESAWENRWVCGKMFDDSVYDMSEYKEDYRVISLRKSIELMEE